MKKLELGLERVMEGLDLLKEELGTVCASLSHTGIDVHVLDNLKFKEVFPDGYEIVTRNSEFFPFQVEYTVGSVKFFTLVRYIKEGETNNENN